jgi:hypothetical protein
VGVDSVFPDLGWLGIRGGWLASGEDCEEIIKDWDTIVRLEVEMGTDTCLNCFDFTYGYEEDSITCPKYM